MIAAIHSTRTKPYPVKDPDGLDFRLSQECEKVLKLSASICFYLDIENKQDEDLFDKLSAIQSVLKKKDYEGIKKFTDELLIAGAILFKLEFEKVARFE